MALLDEGKGVSVNVQVNNETNLAQTIRPGYVLGLSALYGRRDDPPTPDAYPPTLDAEPCETDGSPNDQAAVSLPLVAPDACRGRDAGAPLGPTLLGDMAERDQSSPFVGTRRTRMPPPYRRGSVAIIFVAPVAAAEMGTRFATGFREEEEQQNDHTGHEHGDQPLRSLCAFIRLSFPHSGFSTCSWPLRTDFCGTARRAMVLTTRTVSTRTVFGCPRRRSWKPGRLALDRLARAGRGSACRGRAAGRSRSRSRVPGEPGRGRRGPVPGECIARRPATRRAQAQLA
jgi:hypothetical protein